MRALWADRVAAEAIDTRGAMQKPRELSLFLQFLYGRPICNVLEIGGMHGGTTWCWAQLATGKLVVVDKFILEGRMDHVGVPFALVNADSHLASTRAKVVDLLEGEPVDLLFIDGDHSYQGVWDDYEAYLGLVAEGGVVAFHDTAKPHENVAEHDVVTAWREIREDSLYFELHDPVGDRGHWGGIGVLLP